MILPSVLAVNDGFDVFARAVWRRIHVGEKGHRRHTGFARVGRYAGHDVAMLCHLHVRRSQFIQLLFEHL